MRIWVGLAAAAAAANASGAGAAGLEARISPEAAAPGVSAEHGRLQGRQAVRLRDTAGLVSGHRLVPLPIEEFRDGVIEGRFAGVPLAGASAGARGFVGIAFRVRAEPVRYDAFYVRPTNGRADDQLRRNRATQYISEPDFPWERLRRESPGVYESYADIAPGEWIEFRIEVQGERARLYLGGTDQPVLIVNDLKSGAGAAGGIALWIGPETEGWFADIAVRAGSLDFTSRR